MSQNVTQKIYEAHFLHAEMKPGEEIGIRIDQTLTQDATGTLVMLELEAMGLDRVKTELSVQYVDHNLIQEDHKNPDDHLFLRSACQRFGLWYSPPGNGVSHPVHMERFGVPGKTLLGSDSHTCAAGSLGMLAIGAGGLQVALAMVGEPFYFTMPEVWGVKLTGELSGWVSAKDVILEMLRRHDVDGGRGRIVEYYGPGVANLSAMDRHVIANMGAELGATTTVFPSDDVTREFLRSQGREDQWQELVPDPDATYDQHEEIDLSSVVPLIALPSSPGNVKPVHDVAGEEIYQTYIGSSANPGYRDFAIAAEMVKDRRTDDRVSFDINPTSRQILTNLIEDGHLLSLVKSGARIHQAGCNGCIGMGQAPATERNSLRTVPRNFPGRSGTKEDRVFLVSPETATASALRGEITDPRTLDFPYHRVTEPRSPILETEQLVAPLPEEKSQNVELRKGPNIATLPELSPLPDEVTLPILLKVGDHLSTDEILPAGAKVLPFRSNIPRISEFCFTGVDETYAKRAGEARTPESHAIVAGENYGQGSSREHAALAPRYLGLRVVLAKSYARIHWENLVNFGVLPLVFNDKSDYDRIDQGDSLTIKNLTQKLRNGDEVELTDDSDNVLVTRHDLSKRQVEVLLKGGVINEIRERLRTAIA